MQIVDRYEQQILFVGNIETSHRYFTFWIIHNAQPHVFGQIPTIWHASAASGEAAGILSGSGQFWFILVPVLARPNMKRKAETLGVPSKRCRVAEICWPVVKEE